MTINAEKLLIDIENTTILNNILGIKFTKDELLDIRKYKGYVFYNVLFFTQF